MGDVNKSVSTTKEVGAASVMWDMNKSTMEARVEVWLMTNPL